MIPFQFFISIKLCFQILVNCQYAICGRVNSVRCRNTTPANLDHERVIADIVRNVAVRESDINDRVVVISNWVNNIVNRENIVTLREQVITVRENDIVDKLLCKICLEHETNVVFIPCKHICVCSQCLNRLDICPVCRQYIQCS